MGMVNFKFTEHAVLWSTYAVTNWRNGVIWKDGKIEREKTASSRPVEKPTQIKEITYNHKVKEMGACEKYGKRAVTELALVVLLALSVVEAAARTLCQLIDLGVTCATQDNHFYVHAKAELRKDATTYFIIIPAAILSMMVYNITDNRIGPVRDYIHLQQNYCSCLPEWR